MLFIDDHVIGLRDCEIFENPGFYEINTVINGVPNRLFNKGIFNYDFFDNILKRFNNNLSEKKDFINKFAVWLEFQTFSGSKIHGSVIKMDSHNGIQLTMKRLKVGSGNYTSYVFVVSDGVVNFMNNSLQYYFFFKDKKERK